VFAWFYRWRGSAAEDRLNTPPVAPKRWVSKRVPRQAKTICAWRKGNSGCRSAQEVPACIEVSAIGRNAAHQAPPTVAGWRWPAPRPTGGVGGSPAPGARPGESPFPGVQPSISAMYRLRQLESDITGAGAPRVALWIIVVGIAFAAAALAVIPRFGLVRRVVRAVRRTNGRRPPPG
jgi:hypothetical protein